MEERPCSTGVNILSLQHRDWTIKEEDKLTVLGSFSAVSTNFLSEAAKRAQLDKIALFMRIRNQSFCSRFVK